MAISKEEAEKEYNARVKRIKRSSRKLKYVINVLKKRLSKRGK